ncbi:ATP-binding protein [Nonomuraea candida]|uniref:ATP-binding protein n=1 Tax=Nonomuraea candida TaxID=359159 RepID=UPI0005B8FCC8|nr:ATP-binding protein [Nonomuraea candida]
MQAPIRLDCSITYNLGLIRDLIRVYARHAGLRGARTDHLVIAVNEAVTNVLDHGGSGTVTAYTIPTSVIVEICDRAGRLRAEHLTAADPLPAPPADPERLGLWLIRRLCDEVSLDHPHGHSRLRLRMTLPVAAYLRPWRGGDPSSAAG